MPNKPINSDSCKRRFAPLALAGYRRRYTPLMWLKTMIKKEVFKMVEEGKTYVCEMCGAEVKVIKKPVPDPKCPTLTCCGKEMKEKD